MPHGMVRGPRAFRRIRIEQRPTEQFPTEQPSKEQRPPE
jgi:hypothetical protein